jgi:dTDP-4-amino-4,6-dideoxygalactose transaminase
MLNTQHLKLLLKQKSKLMKQIPFFNYPLLYDQRKEEYQNVLNDVLTRGAYIMQKDLFDFEKNLGEYLNVDHVIGVADGTMAIFSSLMAAGITKGDEVIIPSHTFVATAAAVHHAGGTPILVDCSKDHLISTSKIESLINSKTRAIIPVQLNGRVSDMDPILFLSKKYNLMIIEDSCQALGAKYDNSYAGTFGIAGTFSFFPAKTLGCFGDGGAVITNDGSIAEKVRIIRDHGRDPDDGKVKLFGFNSRLDNIQAAILNLKLKYYDEDISKRRHLASIYHENLKDLNSVLLPPKPEENSKHFDIYQNYEIEVDDRDNLRQYLEDKGIGTILQWGGYALHQFEALGFNQTDLDYTEKMTKKFMLLPMHSMLKDEEIFYICEQINMFFNK